MVSEWKSYANGPGRQPAEPFKALIFAWLAGLVFMFSFIFSSFAEGQTVQPCQFHSWLATIYLNAAHLDQAILADDAQTAQNHHIAIQHDLRQYSDLEVEFQFRDADFDPSRQDMTEFLQEIHHLTSINPIDWVSLTQFVRMVSYRIALTEMRSAMASLRCGADPNWIAGQGDGAGRIIPQDRFADGDGAQSFGDEIPPKQLGAIYLGVLSVLAAATAIIGYFKKRLLRRAPRYPCEIACGIMIDNVVRSGVMADISRIGAQVHSTALTPVSKNCMLHAVGLTVSSDIVWSKGNAFGLRFREPISKRKVKEVLASGQMQTA